ncbi:MAG: 2,3-bisphosphoglycerate-dependent phosphoglycerate mutase [Gammaproteobacteria bacterium]|nr:2,3-bisphosphoglycerate-dependent phosphoglycerate mutase [Gammaproteobacteria bacterium]
MSWLFLLRHGESMWNKENVFTGWVDIPLSAQGINEALEAGTLLADINFSLVYTSTLIRAIDTAMLVLSKNKSGKAPMILHTGEEKQEAWAKIYNDEMAQKVIPVQRDWHLNERYYGELQGKNKKVTADTYGAEQVQIWRRSFDVPPPNGEALKDTAARTIPFFQETILPHIKANKNILIAAHGNSLRSIVMYLDNLSPAEVVKLEIPTGKPIGYEFDSSAGKFMKKIDPIKK